VTIARALCHEGHDRRSAIWQEPMSVGEARARVLRPESSERLAEFDIGVDEVRARPAFGNKGDGQNSVEREGELEHRHGGLCCRCG
jgi:hypothetical protein